MTHTPHLILYTIYFTTVSTFILFIFDLKEVLYLIYFIHMLNHFLLRILLCYRTSILNCSICLFLAYFFTLHQIRITSSLLQGKPPTSKQCNHSKLSSHLHCYAELNKKLLSCTFQQYICYAQRLHEFL
jgi:hypothetical protein